MNFNVTRLRRAKKAEAAFAALRGRSFEHMWECRVIEATRDHHKVGDVVIIAESDLVKL